MKHVVKLSSFIMTVAIVGCVGPDVGPDYAKMSREQWLQNEYAEWKQSYDFVEGTSVERFESQYLKDWRKRNELKYIAHLVEEQKASNKE